MAEDFVNHTQATVIASSASRLTYFLIFLAALSKMGKFPVLEEAWNKK